MLKGCEVAAADGFGYGSEFFEDASGFGAGEEGAGGEAPDYYVGGDEVDED